VTGLTNGMPYWFRVRAMNAIGRSAYSNGSNPVTPMAIVPPSAPVIGAVTAGNGQALIGWAAPDSDGGAPITRYEIQPADASTVVTAPADATQLWMTGLTNGRTYRFKVRAVNASGAGDWSEVSAPVTPVAPATPPVTAPGAVATVSATPGAAGGSRTVTIRWSAPASTGGSKVVSFRVIRQQLNSRGHGIAGTTTTATVSATARATTYTAPHTIATASPSTR
jgi:predicted phage tail protein